MRLLTAVVLLALVRAALAPVPAAVAADAPQKGIEPGDLDRSVAPCDDFFAFANGTWRAQNPIPPSMVRWSRRWAAGESAKDRLKEILDEVSAKTSWPPGSAEQLIGDHYAACMDEAAREPARPRAGEAAARRDRGAAEHRRRAEDDRPLPRDGHQRALRAHRVPGQPPAEPGDRRPVRLRPRPARPRLLRQGRAALQGGAREVPRPRRARDRARRREPRRLAPRRRGDLRAGAGAGQGAARQRGAARPGRDRPQDDVRGAHEPDADVRLAALLRHGEAAAGRAQRAAAGVHAGARRAARAEAARRVEGVPALAPAALARPRTCRRPSSRRTSASTRSTWAAPPR